MIIVVNYFIITVINNTFHSNAVTSLLVPSLSWH